MASKWTVKPLTKDIELVWVDSDGDTAKFWVRVKRQLTVGEQRRVQTAGWKGVKSARPQIPGQEAEATEISIDWRAQSFARAEAWLVDWSLTDDSNAKLPVTREVIESLHADLFEIIEDAVTKHIEDMDLEKKARSGSFEPQATSA